MFAKQLSDLVIIVIFFYPSLTNGQFNISECGVTKGCVTNPAVCDPAINCTKAFSYRIDGAILEMELFGVIASTTQAYIAVGFSDDQSMGGEAVTECSNFDATNQSAFAARLSYNLKPSGSTPRNIRIANLTDAETSTMLQLISRQTSTNAAANITIYCKVRQNIVPTLNISQLQTLNGTYYVLMAAGLTNADGLLMHTFNAYGDFPGPQKIFAASAYTATTTISPIISSTVASQQSTPAIVQPTTTRSLAVNQKTNCLHMMLIASVITISTIFTQPFR